MVSVYVVKQKCTTWPPIKFGVLVIIEAGKARPDGDTIRETTSDEVKELRQESIRLKGAIADLVVRYDVVKKAWNSSNKPYAWIVYTL